jgi:preprotein translocase SecE subunit
MSNFITDAQSELEHVVWPTPAENKKYMTYTIGVIVVIGIFLSILGYVINEGLLKARAQFPHDAITASVSGEDTMNQADLDKMIAGLKVQTGATASGAHTTTGSTIHTGSGQR